VDRKEALAFVERQKLLQAAAGPVPILAEPSAVKKIKWFRKIFGNFIPNFREWVAKTKNYKLKTKPEHV
jgi:hypothetical protein